jgi:hypothetical protein
MVTKYEVRKNTGSRDATDGLPELGGLISKHRTLHGAKLSVAKNAGYFKAPILWVVCDGVRRLRTAEEMEQTI